MLESIIDKRSGCRLEIVMPTFNEAWRAKKFLKYYSPHFDIVLLDGGSTDDTTKLVNQYNASIFKRLVPNELAENYFVYYLDNISKSKICFYLMADEYINRDDLKNAYENLLNKDLVIYTRKIEWTYGKFNPNYKNIKHYSPRGFKIHQARYDPKDLHNSLLCKDKLPENVVNKCDLHHIHIWCMKSTFGKAGSYASIEIEQFLKSKWWLLKFSKRFIYRELVLLPKRMWFERSRGFGFLIWMVLFSFCISLVGFLLLIEYKFLPKVEQQKQQYFDFFNRIP